MQRRTRPISDLVDSREAERTALEAELFGGAPIEVPTAAATVMWSAGPDVSGWAEVALSPEFDEFTSGSPPRGGVVHKRTAEGRRRRLVSVLLAAVGVTIGLGATLFVLRNDGSSSGDGVRVKARESAVTPLATVVPNTIVTVLATAAPTTPPTEPPRTTPTTVRRQVVTPVPIPESEPEPAPTDPPTTTTTPPTTTTTEPPTTTTTTATTTTTTTTTTVP